METISGYDIWKTTPPEDPEPVDYCHQCGVPLYEGDAFYTIDGGDMRGLFGMYIQRDYISEVGTGVFWN